MAKEISLSGSISVNKNSLVFSKAISGYQVDMAGGTYASNAVSVPTTAGGTALTDAAVSTAGYAWFRNTDATNFVTVGVHDGSSNYIPFIKLLPGDFAVVRLATTALYALSDTAATVLEYIILSA